MSETFCCLIAVSIHASMVSIWSGTPLSWILHTHWLSTSWQLVCNFQFLLSHVCTDNAKQATNIGVRESNPAEMDEKASLDLGRRFFRPCRCRIKISRKINETKNGIDYKHDIIRTIISMCIDAKKTTGSSGIRTRDLLLTRQAL